MTHDRHMFLVGLAVFLILAAVLTFGIWLIKQKNLAHREARAAASPPSVVVPTTSPMTVSDVTSLSMDWNTAAIVTLPTGERIFVIRTSSGAACTLLPSVKVEKP